MEQQQLAWWEQPATATNGPTSEGFVARDPNFGLDPWLQKSWDSERTSLPSAASPPEFCCVPNAKPFFFFMECRDGRSLICTSECISIEIACWNTFGTSLTFRNTWS